MLGSCLIKIAGRPTLKKLPVGLFPIDTLVWNG